jgi:hypothetical protein
MWTFDMDGFGPLPAAFAGAGQFTATIRTINGVETPTLSITQSSSASLRLEAVPGKYQIFGDCSGGTLLFNTDSGPSQFDFWFDEFYGEIRFVSTSSQFVITGRAERIVEPDPAADTAKLVPADKLAQYSRWSAVQREHYKFRRFDINQAGGPALRTPLSPDRHQ